MKSNFEIVPIPLSNIFPNLSKEGFIAYCGAGISIPAPTCAPSWWTLTEEILYGFFEKIPKDWGLPNDLIVKDKDFQPEEVFEMFAYVFDEMLYDVFKALDVGAPNGNHQLIARLAKAKILKACFTTNFDSYIEMALRAEGVDFDLIVENPEFEKMLLNIKSRGIGDKFVLCKIHGTTDRPKTIVSIASAYKSSKGFSPPKADVLIWLLDHYPCLFLGYSGWDFEHLNYRRFWERAGKTLKNIYWNRRLGETGGPKFSEIFNDCKDRFTFCEADLPDGLISAISQNKLSNINVKKLNLIDPAENNKYWDKTKNKRIKYFGEWSDKLPLAHKLAAAMSEGELLSARFKARQKKLVEISKSQTTYAGPDPKLTQELQELGMKLSTQQISYEQYNKRNMEIQLEMQLGPVNAEYKPFVRSVFSQNKYPGITDDPSKQQQLLPKITQLLNKFEPQKATEIAIDLMRKDGEAMKKGDPYATAEMFFNQMYLAIFSPDESQWKPLYEKMLVEKEKFIQKKIDLNAYRTSLGTIVSQNAEKELGVTIPVENMLKLLVEVFVGGARNVNEFKTNVEAFHLAANFRYAFINSLMYKTPEYKAIQDICYKQPAPTAAAMPAPAISPQVQQKLVELGQKYAAGKLSIEDYQKQAMAITMAAMQAQAQPQPQAPPQSSGELPVVPIEVLDAYDKRIRDWMRPVLNAQQNYFGNTLNETKILIEMTVFAIWMAGTQYLDINSGTKVQELQRQGLYPKVPSNPSVSKYMWEKNKEWIEKAMNELPNKFIQRLCFYLITFSEMTNDFNLCKRVTEKSLEMIGGVMNETVYHNIPICLAAFYHEQGDLENALKYYTLALDAIKTFVPSVWSDVAIYQVAQLTANKGNKEEALRIILKNHSDFRGNLPPYAPPARNLCKDYAEKLATELHYPNAKAAIENLLK